MYHTSVAYGAKFAALFFSIIVFANRAGSVNSRYVKNFAVQAACAAARVVVGEEFKRISMAAHFLSSSAAMHGGTRAAARRFGYSCFTALSRVNDVPGRYTFVSLATAAQNKSAAPIGDIQPTASAERRTAVPIAAFKQPPAGQQLFSSL